MPTASLRPRRLIQIARQYHVNNLTQLLKSVSNVLFGVLHLSDFLKVFSVVVEV